MLINRVTGVADENASRFVCSLTWFVTCPFRQCNYIFITLIECRVNPVCDPQCHLAGSDPI